jgi:hypothetical protein
VYFLFVQRLLGVNVQNDIAELKKSVPHIVVGTPGRVLDLATTRKALDLSKVKHFVLDECDRMLAEVSMRRDVQAIFMVKLKCHSVIISSQQSMSSGYTPREAGYDVLSNFGQRNSSHLPKILSRCKS